jgi:HAD superfamily phosphatase (TIGR01681 family)
MIYEHEISIDDYKVFVFDLDNTLYLHKVNQKYREMYSIRIRKFLNLLKNNGKIICLASHNKSPYYYLHNMDIYDLFHEIIYEKRDVNPCKNNIYEYTNKKDMIQEILEKTKVTNKDVIFFDDQYYNINEVKSLGIESVYVSPKIGIVLENIKDYIILENIIDN